MTGIKMYTPSEYSTSMVEIERKKAMENEIEKLKARIDFLENEIERLKILQPKVKKSAFQEWSESECIKPPILGIESERKAGWNAMREFIYYHPFWIKGEFYKTDHGKKLKRILEEAEEK